MRNYWTEQGSPKIITEQILLLQLKLRKGSYCITHHNQRDWDLSDEILDQDISCFSKNLSIYTSFLNVLLELKSMSEPERASVIALYYGWFSPKEATLEQVQ
jgi:hypothetical protein